MGVPTRKILWLVVGASLVAVLPQHFRLTSHIASYSYDMADSTVSTSPDEYYPAQNLASSLKTSTTPTTSSNQSPPKGTIGQRIPQSSFMENSNVGADIPILTHMKKHFPLLKTQPLPHQRWSSIDDTTCRGSSKALEDEDWKKYLPSTFLIGSQKSGTSSLAAHLRQHPSVVHTRKELHFFSERMDAMASSNGIDQRVQRQELQEFIEETKQSSPSWWTWRKNPHQIVDATPNYLTMSDRVPQRVLCLCPWAKLVVLLRNPVDRAYSQYNMEMGRQSDSVRHHIPLPPPFSTWVKQDYEVLKHLGILPEDGAKHEPSFFGSAEELEAWKIYTKLGLSMPVGRGLYALQLRHWQQAYAKHNRTLDIHAIRSEEFKNTPDSTYRQVLKHLNLPPFTPQTFQEHHKRSYHNADPISNSTRTFLENVFKPYNEQLAELLGPMWKTVWQ